VLALLCSGTVAALQAQPEQKDRVELTPPAPQSPQAAVSEGWSTRIPYDPPNSRHVKTEITGKEANPIPDSGGKILLKGVEIKQFPLTGGNPQMIADTPQCIADNKFQAVTSDGPLQVHAQGGKFFVEGAGFLFRQNESILWISNSAHAIIQSPGTNAAPGPGTEIFSHRARFKMKEESGGGSAYFEGSVWVNDPKLKLTCESLLADVPKAAPGETNSVNHILAETNVLIDLVSDRGEHTLAAAQTAVYDRTTTNGKPSEVVNLTGKPRIELTNGWMTADAFDLDRITNKLRGHGNFHYHSSGQNKPGAPQNAAVKTTAGDADIFSEEFEFDSNTRVAVFSGHVRADNAQMKLVCEKLTAILPKQESGKTNRIEHSVAEVNVAIDLMDAKTGATNHASCQKAVYDYKVADGKVHETIELNGNPVVETSKPDQWMTADLITLDRAQGTIWGLGNQHSVFKKQPGEPAAMDTEVFSRRFDYASDTGLAVYQDGVRAYDPEMNLTSEWLTVKLAKGGVGGSNHIESITAETNVIMDFLEKAFAAGDITNLPAFAARLKSPAESDGVGRWTVSQLSAPTRKLLDVYQGGTNAALQLALAGDLNLLVERGAVYDAKVFSGVYLSSDVTAMMEKHPLGVDLVEMNRLLLLDAFRGQLRRNQAGEITHGTGERGTYTYQAAGKTSSGVLELSGNPKLQKPNGWVSADQAIIYDRMTGMSQFIGNPHFFLNLSGMVQAKPQKAK
jgi:lipopolysaccharide export system protein LptA